MVTPSGQSQFRLTLLIGCFLVALSVVLAFYHPTQPKVCINDFCLKVEVVSKNEEMMRGLQGRQFLGPQEGMLFVFSQDSVHRFWMKDMVISIDMLWLDQRGKIVSLEENLPPCVGDPCSIYTPTQVARYVLEVQSGFVRHHGLKIGKSLTLKGI